MNPNVKIFVSYHKNCEIIKNEIIIPIQVGASLGNDYLDMIRDNTGDNISIKNSLYSELTAQYWAWENVEADYYGFMHYRRHFIFRDKEIDRDLSEVLMYDYITSEYKKGNCG
jgi:hypothetical protein